MLTVARLPHNYDHNSTRAALRNTGIQFATPQHILLNQHELGGHPTGIRKRRKPTNPLPPMASTRRTPPSDFSSAPPSATLPTQGQAQLAQHLQSQQQRQFNQQQSPQRQLQSQAQAQGQSPTNQDQDQNQNQHGQQPQQFDPATTYSPVNVSPSIHFSPLPQSKSLTMPPAVQSAPLFEQSIFPYGQRTPGAASATGSTHADAERDPFLSLLEQLAENEHSQGGPSELDYFLGSAQG